MKHTVLAYFLAFSAAVAPATVLADSNLPTLDGSRFFMRSSNPIWRTAFGIRHEFSDGFTADLSAFQYRLAKLAGLEPVAVTSYAVLDEALPTETPRPAPTGGIPWGVALLTTAATPAGGASVSVAVLDTGVALHPDLERRIAGCADFTQPGVLDGSCDDRNGHGTHVAGTIAADGGPDGNGIYGMAPQAGILAYKACSDSGSCLADDVAVAIRAAADAGAHVIVLAFGSDEESPLVADAVSYAAGKGAVLVAAAGNDGPYPDSVDSPAALPDVIAVGAMDAARAVPEWASSGDAVRVTAPGVNVESAFTEGRYAIRSGTSIAAAHVAGFIAANRPSDGMSTDDAVAAFADAIGR